MNTALLAPVFAYVAFCFVIVGLMGFTRFRAMTSGQVKGRALTLGQRNWPEQVQRISNVAQNQWETPILFWMVVLLALVLELSAPALVPLAWLYVATRVIHAAIYISVNHILSRFLTFAVGLACMLAMWVVLALAVVAP